ncbi:DUF998 domain-containing protein [Microbispora sp. NPDC049125]|uniref:DUF998 domain-containing protein n=1 Tax=Microbispora sp. NPDC049125 TaxID=3154929 RepID=UPI003466FF30
MTEQTFAVAGAGSRDGACDPATRVTKSLLGYGVIAGPAYVLVSLTEAMTRDGFDLTRHAWSMLSNGDLGWIHITTLVVTGLMIIAFAAGLRRSLRPGRGGTWAPRLVAAYGVSLVAAGAFRADPGLGFPVGTPEGPGPVSWHGLLHFASGGVGFTCLVAACLVIAARFSAEGRRGWARLSRVTGVVFAACFLAMASGSGGTPALLAFTAAVVLSCAWLAAVAAHLYGRVAGR